MMLNLKHAKVKEAFKANGEHELANELSDIETYGLKN